jgi:hypothetical protein
LPLRFAAVEPAHGVGANRPRRDLRRFVLLALAVRRQVDGADDASFDEHVRALLDGRGDTLCQKWLEHNDPVPLCFEVYSSSAFFHKRCVATDSTVNFEPLPFA